MRVKYTEMAGKSRQKSAANVAESVTLSLNERILKDCHSLYTDAENGENVAYGGGDSRVVASRISKQEGPGSIPGGGKEV